MFSHSFTGDFLFQNLHRHLIHNSFMTFIATGELLQRWELLSQPSKSKTNLNLYMVLTSRD